MPNHRVFVLTAVALGVGSIGHALLTWPRSAMLAFFGGGALIAFVAEAIAINLGWLEHHIGPKVIGVPIYVLLAWTGTIYIVFRLVLFVITGWSAVVVTAVIATIYDGLIDHRGVADGHWTYTDDLPGFSYRGVPWWNFVGWFVISALTAAMVVPFL